MKRKNEIAEYYTVVHGKNHIGFRFPYIDFWDHIIPYHACINSNITMGRFSPINSKYVWKINKQLLKWTGAEKISSW